MDRRDSGSPKARQPKGWWQQYLARSGKTKTPAEQKPRVRLRLLLLLWVWAALVFVVVDLFRDVPEFDRIRPRGGLYEAMRLTAHELVGEHIDEERSNADNPARRRVEAERLARLESMSWKRLWRDRQRAEKHPGWKAPDAASPVPTAEEMTIALGALLQQASQGSPRDRRSDDIRALVKLLCAEEPVDALRASATALGSHDVEAPALALVLADRALRSAPERVDPAQAYDLVGGAATEALDRDEASDDAKARASDILATIGTPEAVARLLDLLDAGSPYARSIARISNPDAVPMLVSRLADARIDHVAASLISKALAGCGPTGREELRRLLDPRSSLGWQEHGPAKAAAVTALAGAFRGAEDLFAITEALRQVPGLTDGVAELLRYGKKVTEQAEVTVAFLMRSDPSPLDDALVASLAVYPADVVDPLLVALESARPGSRSRVDEIRKKKTAIQGGVR